MTHSLVTHYRATKFPSGGWMGWQNTAGDGCLFPVWTQFCLSFTHDRSTTLTACLLLLALWQRSSRPATRSGDMERQLKLYELTVMFMKPCLRWLLRSRFYCSWSGTWPPCGLSCCIYLLTGPPTCTKERKRERQRQWGKERRTQCSSTLKQRHKPLR